MFRVIRPLTQTHVSLVIPKQRNRESGNVPRLTYNCRNRDRDDCVDRTRGGGVEVVDERVTLAGVTERAETLT